MTELHRLAGGTDTRPLNRISGRTVWYLLLLVLGYVGVYLCRKNLSVAIPLLQSHFHASRAEVGMIASVSTLVYAFGKIVLGPPIDHLGGKNGLILSFLLVACFGALNVFAPSLFILTVLYSASRFAGAGSWPAMVKLAGEWVPAEKRGRTISLLSMSYVLGGGIGALFAGAMYRIFGTWQAVLAAPSLVLLVLTFASWRLLPKNRESASFRRTSIPLAIRYSTIVTSFRSGRFLIICVLSFILTFLRETFNTWTVDYLTTVGAPLSTAAYASVLFDVGGVGGILCIGWVFDASGRNARRVLLPFLILIGALLLITPIASSLGVEVASLLIGVIGFAIIAPYSLVTGALVLETEGVDRAATASGQIDAVGYLAAALSGAAFGAMIDGFGFSTAIALLSAGAFIAAFAALFLRKDYTEPH